MNFVIHFLVAVLVARCLGYKHDQFETFFIGVAGCLPDIDSIVYFWGYHGTYTHTILIGIGIAFIFAEIVNIIENSLMKDLGVSIKNLCELAILGVLLHLFLDLDTLSSYPCATTIEHMYFWPIWLQSFQGDCLSANFQMWHRDLIEYSILLLMIIIFGYRWLKKKEIFYEIASKSHWQTYYINKKGNY
jgi:hypothetical protein